MVASGVAQVFRRLIKHPGVHVAKARPGIAEESGKLFVWLAWRKGNKHSGYYGGHSDH